ncbi:O-antigen ligase family protein [Patescibacteria group bacterium]|nr:O-antigen ligase family protein [Patescibacteria group bacterium]MBU1663671.1 O-antigen ligase family protein [Patescibacteria group bacterium]MBU1933974.1 O-antigen ligase family protein [Patescibacteria group bacterium]
MSLKTYLNILKTGVYLSFISVFLVFKNLLFPYITSKQIFFNILVEVLMVFWLSLIIKYPAMRPKKSWITFGLAAFCMALFISSILGVDFNLSFWGDIERMLGLFHVAHFFLFYLIVITVFRSQRDWRNLFIVSVIAGVGICLYALLKIPYSTIGNTAYVSGYAIFNLYFALILFFQRRDEEKTKHQDWLVSALYLAAAFIMFLVMSVTNTRGAYVGLSVSFLLFFILYVLYGQSKKVKIYSLAIFVLMVMLVALIFMFHTSKLISSMPILRTIARISSTQVTFQTRLISWKSALKDFPNHVMTGTGYGNFAITFDKYFDPTFYNYTSSETYFDRAHNNLVDIASTAGLISLLAYFSIFAAVFFYLFKGKKQGKISTNEFILLICLFIAYFIQNLVVFDSLATYICLMSVLGYVYWLNVNEHETYPASKGLTNKDLAILAAAGIIILTITYQYNIKVWQMLTGTINGQIQFAKGDIAAGAEEYKKALSLNTPLDRDSRSSLINAINSRQNELAALSGQQAKTIVDYAITLAEANVKLNPADSMMQMQLAQILNTAAVINHDDKSKFSFYSDRALEAIDKSIKASPGRVTIYFSKAQIYITRNDKDNAIKTLKYAVSLNEKYPESVCYLAKAAVYFKQDAADFEHMNKCLDLGGANYLDQVEFIKATLNYYMKKNDQPRMLMLYERWTNLEPTNAKILVNMALLYAQAGEKDKAIAAADKVGALDPSLKSAAEEFIKKLKTE